jgi:hypothetical protein
MSRGAREKALQFLRELPRLSQTNVKGLPGVRLAQPRGYGQNGKERGWGASARQKQYFGPLGYESGSTPIQRLATFGSMPIQRLATFGSMPIQRLANFGSTPIQRLAFWTHAHSEVSHFWIHAHSEVSQFWIHAHSDPRPFRV